MKVYQLSQQDTDDQIIVIVPDHWPLRESRGLPDFYELRDSKGRAAVLLREFDVQELPAMKTAAAGA